MLGSQDWVRAPHPHPLLSLHLKLSRDSNLSLGDWLPLSFKRPPRIKTATVVDLCGHCSDGKRLTDNNKIKHQDWSMEPLSQDYQAAGTIRFPSMQVASWNRLTHDGSADAKHFISQWFSYGPVSGAWYLARSREHYQRSWVSGSGPGLGKGNRGLVSMVSRRSPLQNKPAGRKRNNWNLELIKFVIN